MHTLTQGCSTQVQSKGLTVAVQPGGSFTPVGTGWKNPTAVLRYQWGWVVPEKRLASAGWLCQIYDFSYVMNACFQSKSSGLLCYMQRQVSMQPTGCLQCVGNLRAWMVYLYFWKLAWLTRRHRKSCIPNAFAMIWLCFLGILGIHSHVWSSSNHIPAWRLRLCELMAWAGIGYLQP